jgi:hypothetical protein
MRVASGLFLALTLVVAASSTYAYSFWGINVGTASYDSEIQLTFDGVYGYPDLKYALGSYNYTGVWNGIAYDWYGAHAAASPGASYAVHRKCDAMAIFHIADDNYAKFMILAGTPQTGFTAPEIGYGTREFGPGDLRIVDEHSSDVYGIGLRSKAKVLKWYDGSSPEYKIYYAHTDTVAPITCRNTGTQGDVVKNATWAHVDHSSLGPGDPEAYAFYISDSTNLIGSAVVTAANTGVSISGTDIWAYEVTVGWDLLGVDPGDEYCFNVSWRPDCGNDIISLDLCGSRTYVPEPSSILSLLALCAGGFFRRRRN